MEVELASLADDVQFSAVSARIYRVYGRSSRDVISRWIRAAIRGEELSVYGVESTFDYVFADDVAEGLRRLADSDVTGVVNLASGRSRSVDEVLACLESHFPDLRTSERTPAEVYEASVADLGRLRSAIDWSPPTQLEAGIAGLVEHERDNARRGITSVRVREPVQASVLISSVGAKAHVVRGLRASLHSLNIDGKIWGADIDPQAPARSILDEYWEMPRLNELGVDHLADFCDEHRIRLIIPTRDGELPYYAAERDALRARGIFVPIGSPRSVELTGDKLAFARALDDANLTAIATATSLNDLRVSSSRYVVKQRSGSGSRALHIGIDADEAIRLLGDNDGLIVQPFVDGDEFSVDLYVTEDGRPAGSVARRRDRIVNGEAQITSIVDRPDLTRLAVDAAVAVGVRGHAVVQLIDATGGTQVIECNARVGGASSAAWSSGLRSLDAMLLEALGEVVTPMATVSAPLTQTRLPRDYVDWQ
jgi:carbamoyl-phosphate synthase large subunit